LDVSGRRQKYLETIIGLWDSHRARFSANLSPSLRAKQSSKPQKKDWIASSQGLLAMTGRGFRNPLHVIASEAKQSRSHKEALDCFVVGPMKTANFQFT
jgi:hypothetical protein